MTDPLAHTAMRLIKQVCEALEIHQKRWHIGLIAAMSFIGYLSKVETSRCLLVHWEGEIQKD